MGNLSEGLEGEFEEKAGLTLFDSKEVGSVEELKALAPDEAESEVDFDGLAVYVRVFEAEELMGGGRVVLLKGEVVLVKEGSSRVKEAADGEGEATKDLLAGCSFACSALSVLMAAGEDPNLESASTFDLSKESLR